MKTLIHFFIILLPILACQEESASNSTLSPEPTKASNSPEYLTFFKQHPEFKSTAFDYPVGKPDAKGYYNAQSFQANNHLGDDWNAVTGGNSDLGDPIYAISHGYVVFAKDMGGGWGKVVRIVHMLEGTEPRFVESLYAHCDSILVKKDQPVKIGQQIATIGNADGAYLAHLHFEIRDSVAMPIGGGYSPDTRGYLDPTAFIKSHRKITTSP